MAAQSSFTEGGTMIDIENTIRAPKSFPEIWQPIASAPRDGTFVLTKAGSWQPCITHFATYDGHTRWGSSPEGFMTEEEFLRHWHEVSYDPTEWMPLPMDDVTDAIETAYRNGFEDGERHAGDAALLAQSLADTYKSQLDALTARLKAAKAPPETNVASSMRTFDSAPKDGTWFLAYRGPANFGTWDRYVVIRWHDEFNDFIWPDGPFDIFSDDIDQERDDGRHVSSPYEAGGSFTHWSPLPSPETNVQGLSKWSGWDQSRMPWSEAKHKDAVCYAAFGDTWSMEDAHALISFIERTWQPAATTEGQPDA